MITSEREKNMLRVLTHTSRQFYVCFAILCAIALWGAYGYFVQLRYGLIVTGLRDQISWGLYISNFVFFTGISYGGTLISAILRVTNSAWRHPITRLSEAITVFALSIGGPMVIVDMGRPERMMFLFTHGRLQSVILWDVIAVSTYLAGCALYLYLPLIPDLAVLSKNMGLAPWRRNLYRRLTFGWTGTPEEQHLLERCIAGMAVFMIVLAVSVHTVVSWIFGMTLRPGWNSSIFGPYFVMGAIYSGTAAVVLSMYILVRVMHLGDYIKPLHFRNLGLLLITFSLLYLYFNINDYLTAGYKVEGPEKHLMQQLFFGDYAVLMWATQALMIFIPLIIISAALFMKRFQKYMAPAIAVASVMIIIAAGAKRYLIVVPTLATPFLENKNLPYEYMHYHPTWVEWSITFGGVAVLLLLYMLFTKLFPMVSIWETRHDDAPAESAVAPAAKPAARRWGAISGIPVILLACLLSAAGAARAEQKPPAKPPAPTTLSLEYQQVAAPVSAETKAPQSTGPKASSLDKLFGRLLGWNPAESGEQLENRPAMQITAKLRDSKGQPLSYQVLSLSLKTSFGTLDFGSRPTDEEGKAQFLVKDKRYGKYPVECTYEGGTDFAPAKATATIDFGPRPEPSLPSEGVLIGPDTAAVIAIPFLGFFGFAWFVFVFVGGYILFVRLPQVRRRALKKATASRLQGSRFPASSGLRGKRAGGSAYQVALPNRRP
jgi:Ni/Fe-hydrogenase subunit HybB-like protein